jgi:hypothetical protein
MSHRFPPLTTPAPSRAKTAARRLDLPNLPWFELMAWATFLLMLRQG